MLTNIVLKKLVLSVAFAFVSTMTLASCKTTASSSSFSELSSSLSSEESSSSSADVTSEILMPLIHFNVTLPIDLPTGAHVSMAGTFNSWNPVSPDYILTQVEARHYAFSLELGYEYIDTSIQYKYALILEGQSDNGWTNVEGSSTGGEIGNRNYLVTTGEQTVNDTIAAFKNNTGLTSLTRGKLEKVTLTMTQYADQRTRTIRIWTPDGYDPLDTSKKYPVMYMHDGQNLFDSYTSFSGEWKVDESIGIMMDNGYAGTIVVGIDNSSDRLNEYSPVWTVASAYTTNITNPSGDKYAAFIVDTVKPYVDGHFNTNPSRETTGVGGSSMGGVISFYMAMEYPEVFGYALLFSTAMQVYADLTTENYIASKDFSNTAMLPKLYIYAGGTATSPHPSGESVLTKYIAIMHDSLVANSYPDTLINTRNDTAKTHSESAWSILFPIGYSWLVGLST